MGICIQSSSLGGPKLRTSVPAPTCLGVLAVGYCMSYV